MEIDERKIISMPYGMLGFPKSQRFALFAHKENSPLFWYQSLDDPTLAFVITNPHLFLPGYSVELKEVPLSPLDSPRPSPAQFRF